ncbi:MAG: hypothetical protein NT159_21405 [Proteobacteria bacterium]|nr:hypothetical protein [Pseudomonadota bacterium]
MNQATSNDDGRLSFDEAVAHVLQSGEAAYTVTPIFGDRVDEETRAEGARVFVLLPEEAGEAGGYRLQFVAGPFFSSAYAAHESIAAADIPESIRELRFMTTYCEPEWLTEQVQVLINKLVNAAGAATPEMPNYLDVPAKGAGPEAVFPIAFIGRDPKPPH